MVRTCHVDSCPVGIATQNPELREKFVGTPEQVMAYLVFVAEEVRRILAVARPAQPRRGDRPRRAPAPARDGEPASRLARSRAAARLAPARARRASSARRTSSRRATSWATGSPRTPPRPSTRPGSSSCATRSRTPIAPSARGSAARSGAASAPLRRPVACGRSFDGRRRPGLRRVPRRRRRAPARRARRTTTSARAWAAGASRSGRPRTTPATRSSWATRCSTAPPAASSTARARAGERFAVRNSGAVAVVEGAGDHPCEYMTGGTVVHPRPVRPQPRRRDDRRPGVRLRPGGQARAPPQRRSSCPPTGSRRPRRSSCAGCSSATSTTPGPSVRRALLADWEDGARPLLARRPEGRGRPHRVRRRGHRRRQSGRLRQL